VDSDVGSPLSTCAHADAHEALSAVPEPVYAHQFRDRTASPLADFPVPGYPEDAQHGVELPYLFPGPFGAPLTPEQQELSATTVRYWTTFAATGDPNGSGVPGWHRYRDAGDVQGLDVASAGGVGPVDVAAGSNCSFWASLARA
jgi:para-nitrobenzyl esterase